ncbi:MAG TPA: biotin--[acetyl-CoA-carboxylase] ligase [Polyangiaceae bacterium]|jgi:BirA family biotin operon repressor/biotin-[acetyl-CoA-carboxylase] ligase|nr:biotin--[acetyl-CoA-carboxylase] ligase [Polyangiaceae bacterium]
MIPRLRSVYPDLAGAPDRIAALGGALGRPMHLLATTTSTNDLAKDAAREGAAHGTTWVAEEQTAGRGRRGNAWISPPGEGLLFSVLLRLSCAPARVPPLALVVGLAVHDAVASAAPGAAIGIKWPNDVLFDGRKVAGVLVEAVTVGSRVEAVIAGVGINVHTRAFPEEIAARASSVALAASASGAASPESLDRAAILAAVLHGLDRDVHVAAGRGLGLLRARLDAADVLRGRRVGNDAGDEGVASGIDEDGRLVVRRDDGVVTRWTAGEVQLVRERR